MLSKSEKEVFAILFAASEPVEAEQISEATGIEYDTIIKLMRLMSDKLIEEEFPVQLLTLGSKYQLSTGKEYAQVIKNALDLKRNMPLSQAAMEVLAIIAYNQPVTKSFVEQVRGVDSSSVVNSLCEKALIEEAGRLELPGRPVSYRTNANFLRCFGLSTIAELPSIEEEPPEHKEEEQMEFDM